ncbi:MAG: hemolysin family protein [Pseudomonadota bacterium]
MTLLIVYLTLAIGVSFLCSVLEAVLLSITSSYVAKLAAAKPKSGKRLESVRENLDKSLSSILILNTVAHTMGAVGVGSQALQIFGAEWETLIAVALTLVILYFSEIIPKTLGATYWQPLAVPSAICISWLVRLVYPLVWTATLLTRLFSRKNRHEITRDEIIAMASLGQKDGTLIRQENEYLSNVLSLHEISAEEVLTPRTVVHMLSEDISVTEALAIPETKQFSRIPIYWRDADSVTGKVFRTDLYEAELAGNGAQKIESLAKPITRVSEKLPVQLLLDRFIKERAHLFLVEDEFGQTSGIVTLEDAIETILGREIVDESDKVPDMQQLAREKYRARLREEKQESSES